MRTKALTTALFLALTILFSALESAQRAGSGTELKEEKTLIWMGPGWYYGFWFNDEMEYQSWQQQRSQRHNEKKRAEHRKERHDRYRRN
ncbi:MAG: hypothetical protein WC371_01950 [Parachlamydiales bacterium]